MSKNWKRWTAGFAAVVLPFFLVGCQNQDSSLGAVSDGSVPVSEFDEFVSGLSVEDSETQVESAETLVRFDTDDDGVLSDAEKEQAKEALKTEFLARFDLDQDGEISQEEHRAAREIIRSAFVSRFDTDGDGRISMEERVALGFHHPRLKRARRGNMEEREERRAQMLEQFDADGDGRLSREEKDAARASFAT